MSMVDVHSGHRQRLRERYIKEGLESFEDHQILELLLFYSISRKDTNEIAHRLLDEFGSLARVLEASPEELMKVKDIGMNSAVLLSCFTGLMRRYNQSALSKKPVLSTSYRVNKYAAELMKGRNYENFYMVCLNASCEVINTKKLAEGTLDQVAAYPRRVVETALNSKAHSVILIHNHPEGTEEPSDADINLTRQINIALTSIDVELKDHIVVGKYGCKSMKEFKSY